MDFLPDWIILVSPFYFYFWLDMTHNFQLQTSIVVYYFMTQTVLYIVLKKMESTINIFNIIQSIFHSILFTHVSYTATYTFRFILR